MDSYRAACSLTWCSEGLRSRCVRSARDWRRPVDSRTGVGEGLAEGDAVTPREESELVSS